MTGRMKERNCVRYLWFCAASPGVCPVVMHVMSPVVMHGTEGSLSMLNVSQAAILNCYWCIWYKAYIRHIYIQVKLS
ncbi:hypothetical protein LWI28_027033 [Acer negundo]|uniref:Uncharacterized protein n=1 Tax=Acer negundo TaxID=4023 RepID=A0AAD5JFM7_ACENE|nr:hypothetical protein LWI28_027033 [Acer negundo]